MIGAWPRRLVTGHSFRRPAQYSRQFFVEFMVNTVALEQYTVSPLSVLFIASTIDLQCSNCQLVTIKHGAVHMGLTLAVHIARCCSFCVCLLFPVCNLLPDAVFVTLQY